MKPWQFALVCRKGSIGAGFFPYHQWHKREKENIVKAVGLKIEYGVELEQPRDMGTFKSIGDKEHLEIISLYADEGKGYNKIAEELGRSSRTPYTQVHKHNDAVNSSGFCVICRRAGGTHENEIVSRRK